MPTKTEKDKAEVVWFQAQTISQLVYAGYDKESVVRAVTKEDLSLLKVKK